MMFWGVEVKSGEKIIVQPGKDTLLHVSQACLGVTKKDKGSGYVRIYAKKDGATFVLGILSPDKFPHINFDVVFEDDFELSHDGKHESVHFAGYRAPNPDLDEEENVSDDSDGERVPVKELDNGKSETKEAKPAAAKTTATANAEKAAGKGKVKTVESSKDSKKNENDDDSDEDDDSDSEDGSEEDEDVEGESEEDDDNSDEDSDDESDEETPKKPESSTKRSAEASNKTSGPNKKAKFATPVKTDGKKHVPHVATPYPSKQAGKTSADNDKSKQQTPKSSVSVSCSSCNRSFGSEQALQSHSKAKHGAN